MLTVDAMDDAHLCCLKQNTNTHFVLSHVLPKGPKSTSPSIWSNLSEYSSYDLIYISSHFRAHTLSSTGISEIFFAI